MIRLTRSFGVLQICIESQRGEKRAVEIFGEARLFAGYFVENTESAVVVPAGTGDTAFCQKSRYNAVPVDARIIGTDLKQPNSPQKTGAVRSWLKSAYWSK